MTHRERFDRISEHRALAAQAVERAFDAACTLGTAEAIDALYAAETHHQRLYRLEARVQLALNNEDQ